MLHFHYVHMLVCGKQFHMVHNFSRCNDPRSMYLFLIMWRMKAEIGGKLFEVYQLFVKFIWITYIYMLYVCVNM